MNHTQEYKDAVPQTIARETSTTIINAIKYIELVAEIDDGGDAELAMLLDCAPACRKQLLDILPKSIKAQFLADELEEVLTAPPTDGPITKGPMAEHLKSIFATN